MRRDHRIAPSSTDPITPPRLAAPGTPGKHAPPQTAAGDGRALPPPIQARMEQTFGADFGVVQRLRDPAVNDGASIDIGGLDADGCAHYLAEAQRGTTAVQFEPGDMQALRDRYVEARQLGSAFDAMRTADRPEAWEIILLHQTDANVGTSRIDQALGHLDPYDCGSTAGAMRDVALAGDAQEFGLHHAASTRAMNSQLEPSNPGSGVPQLPSQSAAQFGVQTGTAAELATLAVWMRTQVQPVFVQVTVASTPKGLGHTYAIEQFARSSADAPQLGRVHQSFFNTYWMAEWAKDPKNQVVDIGEHLAALETISGAGDLEAYIREFLTTATEGDFANSHDVTYRIGVSFTARAFDAGATATRMAGMATEVGLVATRLDARQREFYGSDDDSDDEGGDDAGNGL
jgi:hypothetical protein